MDTTARLFDLQLAKSVVSTETKHLYEIENGPWLDLSSYSDYTQEALNHLADNLHDIVGIKIGFRYLSKDAVRALTKLRVPAFFALTGLVRLDVEGASRLWWKKEDGPHAVQIRLTEALGRKSAFFLTIQNRRRLLEISFPSIDWDVANVLRNNQCRLNLIVRDEPLSLSAAVALAHHNGIELTLNLPTEPSAIVLEGLSCNPAKRVDQASCRTVVQVMARDPSRIEDSTFTIDRNDDESA